MSSAQAQLGFRDRTETFTFYLNNPSRCLAKAHNRAEDEAFKQALEDTKDRAFSVESFKNDHAAGVQLSITPTDKDWFKKQQRGC